MAFLELSRLFTGYLSRWRAFDFRDDWDDVIQDVILATVQASRNGRLDHPQAVSGYIRSATRNKFVDRIRARQRIALDQDAEEAADRVHWPPNESVSRNERIELWDVVSRLPEKQQEVVVQIYVQGRTYEEASQASGIPLGSLKRYLRQALETLHGQMAAVTPEP